MLRPMSVFAGSPRRAFFGRCVISLAVATSFMAAGVAVVNHGIDDRIGQIHRIALREAEPPPQGANFLIIGSDTRTFAGQSGDVGGFGDPSVDPNAQGKRSDTLMVAHVEPGSQHTLVVSFPRDLWVDIPGLQGKHKINAAYDAEGAQGVIDTLKVNFGIDIHHYMQVDFQSFQAVVKTIGNVKVSFPYPARHAGGAHRIGRGLLPARRGVGARVRAIAVPRVLHRRPVAVRRAGRPRPPPHRTPAEVHQEARRPRDREEPRRSHSWASTSPTPCSAI